MKRPNPKIIYEDGCIRIIEKPAGMHSLSQKDKPDEETLESFLRAHDRTLDEVSEEHFDAGLLQRLDFDTSGLVLAACTLENWIILRDYHSRGLIEKSYLALVERPFENVRENIAIWSRYRRSKKVSFVAGEGASESSGSRARVSRTELNCVSKNGPLEPAAARAHLNRGLRHQVRAHLASKGSPLVGDELYGANSSVRESEKEYTPSFLLHAEQLSFPHPEDGRLLRYSAPIPEYFLMNINSLGLVVPASD